MKSLPTWDEESGALNVVVETPKGSRNKYAFDKKTELFVMKTVLPAGHSFPFDFGYVPGTIGEDGDPLDVLVLMDDPAFAGCLVHCRLVGVIEARQTERDGRQERNDRLIAVCEEARTHSHVQSLDDLNDTLIDEMEQFFRSYNESHGKKFEPLGRKGPDTAKRLVEEATRKK